MDNRVWSLCTKWFGDASYELAKQAVTFLNTLDYNIQLDDTIHSGLGFADLMSDGSLQHTVGIKELIEKPNERFTIREALAPTVACFHEVCGHGGQWRNESKKNGPLSKVLLLSDLACKGSGEYYGVISLDEDPLPQYFEHPHEMAAQYMGLKMAQKFLSAVYDEETADKLLCEYVNLRIAHGSEYIKAPESYEMEKPLDDRPPFMKPTEPFTSMSQVYEQFQKSFLERVFEPVDYVTTKSSIDSIETYIKEQKWPWERSLSRKQFNQISDRLTQTYVMSAAWLEQHESYSWIKNLPVFEHMNFPKGVSQLIQNTPEQPENDELDLELLTEDSIDFTQAVEQIRLDTGQEL